MPVPSWVYKGKNVDLPISIEKIKIQENNAHIIVSRGHVYTKWMKGDTKCHKIRLF